MNRLDRKTRTQILHRLCEGQSIRAVAGLIGCSKNTSPSCSFPLVTPAPPIRTGRFAPCRASASRWMKSGASFTPKKAKAAPATAGDLWTWTALCADTKLIVSWLLGARDLDAALAFTHDLESRLANHVQLTSDGHRPYLQAIEAA